jgi:hypothetical protein
MTTVINIANAPPGWTTNTDYVYIGRPGKGLNGPWGNPFTLRNEKDRSYILVEYEEWLYRQPQKFLDKMDAELYGKILVCFCKPKACHGDIIVSYVDRGI